MAVDQGGGAAKTPKASVAPKVPGFKVTGSASVTKPQATISAPRAPGLGAKGVQPPTRPTAPVVVTPTVPKLTWSPLFGLRSGSDQARIGTYGVEVNQGGLWMSAADFVNQRVTDSFSGSEPKGATYQAPVDTSWRAYLADPTKPEEAAPSLVEQSRIMGAISRAINSLDDGGAGDGGMGDWAFDDSGYGWDGGGGGGGYGSSGYGPDGMLYQWRIGL